MGGWLLFWCLIGPALLQKGRLGFRLNRRFAAQGLGIRCHE